VTVVLDRLFGFVWDAVRGFPRWRAYKVEDVRRVVVRLRVLMTDAAAHGGLTSDKYLTPEVQTLELELGDLCKRLHSPQLRRRCRRVLAEYKDAWASSPPPHVRYINTSNGSTYVDPPGRQEQRQRQVAHAHAALTAIDAVLRTCARLERWRT
jgi:hypothetical protein